LATFLLGSFFWIVFGPDGTPCRVVFCLLPVTGPPVPRSPLFFGLSHVIPFGPYRRSIHPANLGMVSSRWERLPGARSGIDGRPATRISATPTFSRPWCRSLPPPRFFDRRVSYVSFFPFFRRSWYLVSCQVFIAEFLVKSARVFIFLFPFPLPFFPLFVSYHGWVFFVHS